MDWIDNFLNNITMYRLVLYYLLVLLVLALILACFGRLPFGPLALLFSAAFLLAVCWLANELFAKVFAAHANVESVYITAFILALVLLPGKTPAAYAFPFWAAVLAMASKYILAINKKHIFNPVAIALTLTGLFLGKAGSWWVGTPLMLPAVLLGGILIVRKIRRLDLVFSFLAASLITTLVFAVLQGADILTVGKEALLYSCLWFFAFVMLTEPLTTPPTKNLQILYGGLVGILFAPQFHLGSLYFSPEYALAAGNVFSYLVSPKSKLMLTLKQTVNLGGGMYDFIFSADRPLKFRAGQYLEWTLGHSPSDSRGNRRYFTVASSPLQKDIRLGVKFYEPASSFKRALLALQPGQTITAGQLAGDFVLPKDANEPCVLIAGGIGITPFRSMLEYLLDRRQKRPLTIIFANRTAEEIVYRDILDRAQKELGAKIFYTLTDSSRLPAGWTGQTGYVDAAMVKHLVPDYSRSRFYISGPNRMVKTAEKVLRELRLPESRIVTDFFPGFA
ncbi:MAG TPA: RnfABCDGE type electron transport complex subunit D [Patescibacteria group bacterium]|nr:RnfABCDGE type electron transport complex subunit D [Patescibacteria group bacterium]